MPIVEVMAGSGWCGARFVVAGGWVWFWEMPVLEMMAGSLKFWVVKFWKRRLLRGIVLPDRGGRGMTESGGLCTTLYDSVLTLALLLVMYDERAFV